MNIPASPEEYSWRAAMIDEVICTLDELQEGNLILCGDYVRRADPKKEKVSSTQSEGEFSVSMGTAYWGKLLSVKPLGGTDLVLLERLLANGKVHVWPVHSGYSSWLVKQASRTS